MLTEREVVGSDLIYLAGCAVNRRKPEQARVDAMNLDAVHALSRFCGLSALTYRAVEPFLEKDSEIQKSWKEDDNTAFSRCVRFDAERKKVLAFLEEEKIRYLPLKGIVIKNFYPEPYLREMVDNDILYDAQRQKDVNRLFLEHGYRAETYRVGVHDVYQKEPIYNFEMHTALAGGALNPAWEDYSRGVWERALPEEGRAYGYRFSDEDFYVYFMLHGCKHQVQGGIGIHTLLDCYVYTKEKGMHLDRERIRQDLGRLDLTDYAGLAQTLAEKLFADPAAFAIENLEARERTALEEFLSAGTSGTMEQRARQWMKGAGFDDKAPSGWAKLRYLVRRVFPDTAFMAGYLPILARHRWLLPFGYLYRFVRGLRKHAKLIGEEIRAVHKM